MTATDKRDECGCHRGCTVEMFGPQHPCDNRCAWPACLTTDENAELLAELGPFTNPCPTCTGQGCDQCNGWGWTRQAAMP